MSFLPTLTLQNLFGTARKVGNITVQCVITEETTDTLSITKQPVQTGASITDHAYMEPTVLSMRILQQSGNPITGIINTFSGGGLSQVYKQFQELQKSREPFSVITPKRVYDSMLIAVLRCNTDKNSENVLSLDISFQSVIFVPIGTLVAGKAVQLNPAATQGVQNVGTGSAGFQVKELAGKILGGP